MEKDIKSWLKENLSEERYMHVLGAQEAAIELARRFGQDEEKAGLAALIHDCAKCIKTEELIKIIKENNLEVSEMEMKSYKTLHAVVGPFIACKEFGICDQDILNAIRFHTIGRIGMSILEKIVFLADKIESKTRNPQFIEEVVKILDETNNMDEAVLFCYDATIKSLLRRKLIINPETIDVYNDLLIKLYH